MVIDSGTGKISGREKSFGAQQVQRKFVSHVRATGTEVSTLKAFDPMLREGRNEASMQARSTDQEFMKKLAEQSSRPVKKKKRSLW